MSEKVKKVDELEAIKTMNLFEKLSNITEEIGFVAKNLNVINYKAVGEVDVLEAVKPLEKKYRVYSYPFERQVIVDKEVEIGSKATINQFIRVETVYRFVNIDKPTEFIDVKTYGDGVDTQDKAPGKAMTYGDKYALLKAYKISTGDDPDKDKSEDKVSTKKQVRPRQEPTAPTKTKANKLEEVIALYSTEVINNSILPHYKVNALTELSHEQLDIVIANAKRNK